MDAEDFKRCGKEMIEYICQYLDTVGTRPVTPGIEMGYLKKLLPSEAPNEPEAWESIMKDIESKIMPGLTHWQHPRFHAFFASGNSFPTILADMLSDTLGCLGVTWEASPACTELESLVLDWFGRAIGLPDFFLASGQNSKGGGVLQSSASDCILSVMLSARYRAIKYLKRKDEDAVDSAFLPLLVAYCSKEAHSCVEKAANLCLVKLRILEPDENNNLRGETLRKAIEEDKKQGLVPFFVSLTLGTTACCSFDNLVEIGPICKAEETIWMHVDGAYGGNGFICPELRHIMAGIEYSDSFNTNPNKWLLVSFDCSAMWVRDREEFTEAFVVNPYYLQKTKTDKAEKEEKKEFIDYRHWGTPLSRRFRSLKLWFLFRCYGIKGLQNYIRNQCKLAKLFESLVLKDDRFEIMNDVQMGLVCFRLKQSDDLTLNLLRNINNSREMFLTPAIIQNKRIIRFLLVKEHATEADIKRAWEAIQAFANEILPKPYEGQSTLPNQRKVSQRFFFTKTVPRELFNISRSKPFLRDGSTPILVPED